MADNNVGTSHAGAVERGGMKRRLWRGLALGSMFLVACHSGLQSAEAPRETVELRVLTPDVGWKFRVREVRETPEAIWVWADLDRGDGPAAQQLTTVSTHVDLPAGKERRIFVTGKTWAWENDEPYMFVDRAPNWPSGSTPVSPTERDETEK